MAYDFVPHPSRRSFLAFGAATFAAASIPKIASAAERARSRLIVLILRGALDGLSAVGPVGDPDYVGLHGDIALSFSGDHAAIRLNDFFGLNPAMTNFARLYDAKQALLVHAVATNYRDRSHFDGQDVLESGMLAPGRTESGWLNRAIDALPAGDKVEAPNGLAVGAIAPLVIRGPAPILGWAASGLQAPTADLVNRTLSNYEHVDPVAGDGVARGLLCRGAGDQGRHDGRQGRRRRGRGDASGRRRRRAADGGRQRPAHRRARDRRLGHARQRGRRDRPARAIARRPRPGVRRFSDRTWRSLERHRRCRGDGVWPHGADQRHGRHGPWHGHGRLPRRRRGRRRARGRGLARPQGRQPVRRARPEADERSSRGA